MFEGKELSIYSIFSEQQGGCQLDSDVPEMDAIIVKSVRPLCASAGYGATDLAVWVSQFKLKRVRIPSQVKLSQFSWTHRLNNRDCAVPDSHLSAISQFRVQ